MAALHKLVYVNLSTLDDRTPVKRERIRSKRLWVVSLCITEEQPDAKKQANELMWNKLSLVQTQRAKSEKKGRWLWIFRSYYRIKFPTKMVTKSQPSQNLNNFWFSDVIINKLVESKYGFERGGRKMSKYWFSRQYLCIFAAFKGQLRGQGAS